MKSGYICLTQRRKDAKAIVCNLSLWIIKRSMYFKLRWIRSPEFKIWGLG